MKNDLEKYLEQLTKLSEVDWLKYIDKDFKGKCVLGERFFKYKQDINSVRIVLEKHFN